MSQKAELSENILAANLEKALLWIFERRVQVLISIGVLVATILIGSVFIIRRNERIDTARTKLAFAQALISQQQYAQADEFLKDVQSSSTNANLRRLSTYLSGVAALEQNKWDEAQSLLAQSVDISAGHPLRALARSNLGTVLEQKGDYAGAIANYQAFLTESPDHFLSPRVQLALGRSFLNAGQVADGKSTLEHLIDQFPTSEWAENARRLLDKSNSR